MAESLRIEISLASPGVWRVVERSHLAAESVSRITFQPVELTDLVGEINQCLLDANVNQEVQRVRLRRLGGRLAEITLPHSLQDKVAGSIVPVEFFLDNDSIHLPVEMFPSGEAVLAESLPVSRHWFCENVVETSRKASSKCKHALIVADPAENLPGAQREGEEIYRKLRTLDKNWHCRYLGRSVTGMELTKEIPDTDLLHLAAHYRIGDSDTPAGIVMNDGVWMPTPSSRTPDLVFVNCCRAGLTSSHDGTLSLVGIFLQRGTRHVIAPFLPASDNIGRLFANAFYKELLSGVDAAMAIWKARKAIGPASWIYWYFGVVSNSISEFDGPYKRVQASTQKVTSPSLETKSQHQADKFKSVGPNNVITDHKSLASQQTKKPTGPKLGFTWKSCLTIILWIYLILWVIAKIKG